MNDDLIFFWEFSRQHNERKLTATLSNPIFVLWFRLKVVDWYSTYYQLLLIRARIHEKYHILLKCHIYSAAAFNNLCKIVPIRSTFEYSKIQIQRMKCTHSMYTENTVCTPHTTHNNGEKTNNDYEWNGAFLNGIIRKRKGNNPVRVYRISFGNKSCDKVHMRFKINVKC